MSVKIALAVNPNCGKTTLFNALTGSNQFVGNWPGVTVEKKEGKLKGHKDVTIMDLPGIYSLSPYTLEEIVARNYLINERPDAIINIVDGTNIERNLYLSTQIMELGIPVVMAVNMMDLVEKAGDKIHTDKLSKLLGCEVVEISALKGTGIQKAAEKAISLAERKNEVTPVHEFDSKVEDAITAVGTMLGMDIPEAQKRFFAIKLLEKDDKIKEQMKLVPDVSNEIKALEDVFDDDTESIITNERYVYISSIIGKCVTKGRKGGMTVSDKIDRWVTNRWLALPIFAAVMFIVYYVSITTVGAFLTDWTNDVLFGEIIPPAVEKLLVAVNCADWLQGLILDGIVAGVGAVLGFVPQMLVLFIFLAFLEGCGYMARVAFIMDRIFRKFGVSGKSFIPFLISSGCGVPGIMATRTIENEKDRRMTMMTTTAIPCGAKLPVLALLGGYIMGDKVGLLTAGFYFIGIAVVVIACIILKKTKLFAGDPAPFVMELPEYHIPSIKNVLLHVWERVWAFLKKAGTILFLCCAVMWFLGNFGVIDGSFKLLDTESSEIEYCFLAIIGGAIAPIFAPLGFGTWRAVAATLSGFVAKEGITSTMGVIAGFDGEAEAYSESMRNAFNSFLSTNGQTAAGVLTLAAISFLVFNLFDSPCLAAISTMAKEIGSKKYFWFAILFQNVMAYCLSLMVYQIGGLITGLVSFNAGTVFALIILAVLLYLLFRPDPSKKLKKKAMAAA